jgi:hypothetical protein
MFNIAFGGSALNSFKGIHRRQILRIGATGLFAGLNLPRLLEAEDRAAVAAGPATKARGCIFIFLEGGPPHQDMWDPKPDAPAEIRGAFSAIPTSVASTIFSEHCSNCARIAHKFTVVRSHTHPDNGHTTGYHYVMTGRRASFSDGENPIPNNDLYPSLGSVVARELGSNVRVPPYINMPHPMAAGGPGFYGAEYAPFVIESDPSQPDFEVKDLADLAGLSSERLDLRRRLLEGVERIGKQSGRAAIMATYYSKAFHLITSREAGRAFRIQDEPQSHRDAYGMTQIGQCAILARRLIEAGCRFVGIDAPGWDVHLNCFPSLKGDLIPPADQAFAALVNDLGERGLLDSTLVVMMGEMGRTPRVNAQAGRDHWSMAQSILFAGGGTKPGRIIGATDKQAAAVTSDPVSVSDLLFTIHTLLGIDPAKEYYTPLGRPVPIVDGGKLIPGLT